MEIIIAHTINETSVVLDIEDTVYSPGLGSRSHYAAIMYVNTKKTTGDAPIIIPAYNYLSTFAWTLVNMADGYNKAEVLMMPDFLNGLVGFAEENEPHTIPIGVVTHHEGLFYRSVNAIDNIWDNPITPDIDYNNWEPINITKIEDVYNEVLMNDIPEFARTRYGYDEFVFFNNLMYAFLNLSAAITKSCNICANPQIEVLRCLRDKYESVELAIGAGNYSGAQTIIESSQNLVNSCSC